jgi:hypothetical protein
MTIFSRAQIARDSRSAAAPMSRNPSGEGNAEKPWSSSASDVKPRAA